MPRTTGLFKKTRANREESIVVTKGNNGVNDENYTRLKDNLFIYFGETPGGKVIQVESSIAGEGKTTTACNLAVSIALNDKKVALMDFDFRRPRAHRPFKIMSDLGIGDYVVGKATEEQIIKHTEYGVDIITAGKSVSNTSLVLTSDAIHRLIESLRSKYEYIILDCPPILLISDYINISKLSDGVLFVVAAGYTKKGSVREAFDLLKRANAKIIGSVITFSDQAMSNYYYYSKYHYYGYGYRAKYGERYGSYGDKSEAHSKKKK